ncbi:hypothetical protein [Micromonospora mirobrigensis]|uniref:Uncharacterized protein n=1 Tax=Micromonospora mirobrigensis TaxID=262898 RepID=A0A1C4WR93_9ACTN|nr:hypothetical protein [Micromonospora mirobrigensis]SCE98720.1 hypothetical protein GA0070564_102453 [Micromonospora mirobrigensis]
MTLTPFQSSQVKQGAVGNDAGWTLEFHRQTPTGTAPLPLTLSSASHYASIDATLEEGLRPGAFKITIEGLSDEHYAALRAGDQPLVAKLYLYWRDANTSVGAFFTNLVGLNAGPSAAELDQALVAELRVRKIRRLTGDKTYDTELTLVEQAYARLGQRVTERFEAQTFSAAVREIGRRTGVSVATWGAAPDGTMTRSTAEAAGAERLVLGPGLLYTAALDRIGTAIAHSVNRFGRSMLLIRDGTVHVGERPIPYPEGSPKPMTLATGLLECTEDEPRETDPYAATESTGAAPPTRTGWTLTCKGRPDVKPGDVLRFDPPPQQEANTLGSVGAALLGSFAAPFAPSTGELGPDAKLLYVSSVRHQLSKSAGFATEVHGVEIDSTASAWDSWSDAGPGPTPGPAAGGSPGTAAAEAVRRAARAATGEARGLEVGEVRAVATNASGAVEPPAQTETVWEGLVRPDGRPNGARRLPPRREQPAPLPGVSYLTPFAWGGCGLILPRYPGTRVALAYRNGRPDDPVDVGALWPSGHAPVSQPGDWWLSLPVGVAAADRSSVADTAVPADHAGKVAHDLTDGDGNRVIELGELTVRVGRAQLQGRGHRPARAAAADSITIEHAGGGSKIVLKQDGSITITGTRIDLDAGTGNINLTAANVDVHVSGSMNVH